MSCDCDRDRGLSIGIKLARFVLHQSCTAESEVERENVGPCACGSMYTSSRICASYEVHSSHLETDSCQLRRVERGKEARAINGKDMMIHLDGLPSTYLDHTKTIGTR